MTSSVRKCEGILTIEMLEKPLIMRLSEDVTDYFKHKSVQAGLPCQNLIKFHFSNAIVHQRKAEMIWPPRH